MSAKKTRVLVVEDEILVGIMLARKLEAFGYAVGEVIINGEEAVEVAGRQRPDVILMDIALSGNLNGLEAARQIRRRYNIPVIIFTGYDTEKLSREVGDINPVAVVSKLDTIEEVLRAIAKAVGA